MGQGRKPTLYISSTLRDLKEHQAALKIALDRAACAITPMSGSAQHSAVQLR